MLNIRLIAISRVLRAVLHNLGMLHVKLDARVHDSQTFVVIIATDLFTLNGPDCEQPCGVHPHDMLHTKSVIFMYKLSLRSCSTELLLDLTLRIHNYQTIYPKPQGQRDPLVLTDKPALIRNPYKTLRGINS